MLYVWNRLFTHQPHLMAMFPSLAAQFPDEKIYDQDSFRKNKTIKRHGTAVVFMLDQMISEIDNSQYLNIFFEKAVEKHIHLKGRKMKGENFLVFLND